MRECRQQLVRSDFIVMVSFVLSFDLECLIR